MIAPWAARPIEEASLFNPAFGSLMLAKAAADFHKQTGEGIPYPLAFLVMPVVLHTETRDVLPATTRAVMHNWIGEHAPLLAGFPDRVRRMVPVTRESVLFALVYKKLALSGGRLSPGLHRYRPNAVSPDTTTETERCLRAAAFLGRWLVTGGTAATVLSAWGLRP
jgi:Family of unknown function (DUF6521)